MMTKFHMELSSIQMVGSQKKECLNAFIEED